MGAGGALSYAGYRAGAVVARTLPARLARPAATATGSLMRHAMGGRARMLRRHLGRVHGGDGTDLEAAVAAGFDSYARYWLESFRLDRAAPGDIRRRLAVEGLEHVDAAMAGGRGVIVATTHLGNWDLGAAWFAAAGYRPITVVEAIEPPALFEWFCRRRRALGIDIVALGDDTGPKLTKALADGRMVGLISDRDISGRGIPVDFFGERTTLPGGPATLALRAKVDVVSAAAYFSEDGPDRCVIRRPIDITRQGRLGEDVARITQAMAQELEALIRAAPEQWHMLQPNWPSDRDQ